MMKLRAPFNESVDCAQPTRQGVDFSDYNLLDVESQNFVNEFEMRQLALQGRGQSIREVSVENLMLPNVGTVREH